MDARETMVPPRKLRVERFGAASLWTACRSLLGAILITAAALKVYELSTLPLLQPGLLNERWLLATVVEIESVFGAWLLVGMGSKWTWVGTLALWLTFLGVSGYESITGASSCGCFGRLAFNPRYTASFDLAVVLTLAFCRPGTLKSEMHYAAWRWCIMCTVAAAGIGFGIWNLNRYSTIRLSADGLTLVEGTIVLEPNKWVGHPFALANYIDIGPQIIRGNWMVLLYRYDCEHCQRAIPRYEAFADQSSGTGFDSHRVSVALVEIPPYAPAIQESARSKTIAMFGRLNADRDWFASTPVAVQLHDGIVEATSESDAAEEPAMK